MTPPSQPSPLSQIVWVAPLSPMPYIWLSSAHSGLYRCGPLDATAVHLPLRSILQFRPVVLRRRLRVVDDDIMPAGRRATTETGGNRGRVTTRLCHWTPRFGRHDRIADNVHPCRLLPSVGVISIQIERILIIRSFLYRVSSFGGVGNAATEEPTVRRRLSQSGSSGAGERRLDFRTGR